MMSQSWLWLVVVVVGLATFAFRVSFILLSGRTGREFSPAFKGMLALIPAAVLSALIAPQFLLLPGQGGFSLANPRLWAGLIALIVAWRTSNLAATIAVGMVALWLLQWLMI